MFYKNRMAGNKERERVANAKLVAENEHLLPRVRALEKKAAEMEKPLVEKEEKLEEISTPIAQKLLRKQKVKRRLLVGGGVEERMEVD